MKVEKKGLPAILVNVSANARQLPMLSVGIDPILDGGSLSEQSPVRHFSLLPGSKTNGYF